MKILKFTAENVKKLKIVEITPAGAMVQVTGKNGQGKSSVLDSIWWALAGKGAIQKEPVRRGAEKGRIELDLGDYIVERRFSKDGGSTIHVRNREGAVYGSPQTMLDALVGGLSFDPLAFARMEPKKQFEELRRIAKVDLDIEGIDGLNRADFSTRTDVNRQAKAARARLSGIVVPDLKITASDESELLNQLQAAGEHNASVESVKANRILAQRNAASMREDAARLKAEAAKLRLQAEEADRKAVHLTESADLSESAAASLNVPDPIDVSALRTKLDEAKQNNSLIAQRDRKAEELKQATADAEKLEARAKQLTEQMEAREQAKTAAISAAPMPVDGLGFGDGEVTYNGIPFEQASDAERLRVSVAIAMAANPKLRVIRVRDGSLLDEEALNALAEIAAEKDYQVWIERVDGSGKIGVVLEDGAVVADHQDAQ